MESTHGAQPPTVKPAAMAGDDHENGNQGQNDKTEHGIVVAADDYHRQQDSHERLALLSAANLFYL